MSIIDAWRCEATFGLLEPRPVRWGSVDSDGFLAQLARDWRELGATRAPIWGQIEPSGGYTRLTQTDPSCSSLLGRVSALLAGALLVSIASRCHPCPLMNSSSSSPLLT